MKFTHNEHILQPPYLKCVLLWSPLPFGVCTIHVVYMERTVVGTYSSNIWEIILQRAWRLGLRPRVAGDFALLGTEPEY